MNAQTNHGRLSDVAHVGHLFANAAQNSHAHTFHVQIVGTNSIAWAHGDPTVIRYLSYCQSPVIANYRFNFSNHFLVSQCRLTSRAGVAFNGGSTTSYLTPCIQPTYVEYNCLLIFFHLSTWRWAMKRAETCSCSWCNKCRGRLQRRFYHLLPPPLYTTHISGV